ncbi:MAG: DUF427 domain-containing protein [Mangrovicoccus sp.]|nr:DUF427 domain-containing protein [Mangrovicoccus sp.]
MIKDITIRDAAGTWVVRAGGAVLAETNRALELTEGEMPPVIFFPRSDIAMAFLEQSEAHTEHDETRFFAVVSKSQTIEEAGWCYQDPPAEMAALKDHIAFHDNKVTVERL